MPKKILASALLSLGLPLGAEAAAPSVAVDIAPYTPWLVKSWRG
ncbi:hypothetical protein [Dongshaea marina]|nr:hypothetical protein [Dongshaea marina]